MTLLHYLEHSRRRWWCHCKCLSDGASAIKGHLLGGEGIRLWRGNGKSTATFWRPSAFFGLLHLVLLSWCTTTQLLYSACTAFIAIPRRTCCKYHSQPQSVEGGRRRKGMEVQNVLFMQFLHWAQDVWVVLFNGWLCFSTKDVGRTQ